MALIPMGVVTKPFGIKGEVRVKPHNPRTVWFDAAESVWLRANENEDPKRVGIVKSRRHKDMLVLAFEGVRDRDGAEAIRGHELLADESELEPLGDDEYYWHQLVGLSAETEDGERLGPVLRMEETRPDLGGADLFVIETETGEIMVPAASGAVIDIDIVSRRIVVSRDYVA